MQKLKFYGHILTVLFSILYLTCSKNSSQSDEVDPLRYKFPQYGDGHVLFSHSFYYPDCGDSYYWSVLLHSKKFNANDTLYFSMSEQIINETMPNLTLNEKANLLFSNGDKEIVVFNKPFPPCALHIQNVLLRFGLFPTRKGDLNEHNGFIDVLQDTVEVVVEYKSYWSGNIVTDTAYVYP